MANEDKILVVQKNPFGADVEIDVNVDGWVRAEFYHEAKKERRGVDENKNTENKERRGRYWKADSLAWSKNVHINPAALRSFCSLASSAQACANRTSGSEDGLPISSLFPPWFILAAVSAETGAV